MILDALGEMIGGVISFLIEIVIWIFMAVIELVVSIWNRRELSWPKYKRGGSKKNNDQDIERDEEDED